MRKLYFFLGLLGIALVISLFIFINNKNQTTTEQTDFPDEIGNSILPTTIEKIYKEEEKKVELTDTITTEKVADIKLNTPLIHHVMRGKNRLVAEFTINNYKDYENVLREMEFYDMRKEMAPIEKDFTYKYKVVTGTKEVPYYEEVCREQEKNETLDCSYEFIRNNKEDIFEWREFKQEELNYFQKGNITIGIFTDVKAGDYIEWIPTLYGIKIDEWAIWLESMNVSLNYSYSMNATSGTTVVDDFGGHQDAGFTGSPTWVSFGGGLSKYALNTTATGYASGNLMQITSDFAISLWFNPEHLYNETSLIENSTNAAGGSNQNLRIRYAKLENRICSQVGSNGARWICGTADAYTNGSWNNVIFTCYGAFNNCVTYVNGVQKTTYNFDGSPNIATFNLGRLYGGTGTNSMKISDVYFWRRTLNATEIADLSNWTFYLNYPPVIIPDTSLKVTLIEPVNYYNTSSNQVAFNCTAEDDYLIQNITLWINTEQNYTLNHGTSNYTSLYILLNLSDGNYVWTCTADDNATATQTGVIANRSFSIRKFEIDSVSYNSSSYETSSESFSMNITTNSSYNFSSPVFIYNGTSYPATITCEGTACVLSGSLIVPLNLNGVHKHNNPFYWKVNYTGDASGEGVTTISNQSVEKITFALCNATLTTKYLNITFKDEGTLGRMNASITTSSWTYWLGDGSINRTYSYSTLSNFSEYDFCFSPLNRTVNTDYTLQYRLDGYPQRTYSAIRSYTNITTSLTLWLLSSLDGVYTTYITINTAEQPLEGVQVNVTRILDGAVVTISEGTTDASGSVTKFLHPDFLHTFTFVLAGYETFITSIFPSQTAYPYIIDMGGSTEDPVYDFTKGIQIQVKPERILYNDTTYNFNFTLSSDYWNVDEFGFYFYFPNRTSIGHVYSTTNGGVVTYNFNTQNYTRVEMTYYWVIDSNHTNGTAYWLIYSSGGTQYSITNFFNRLSTYLSAGIFGADEFTVSIIIFILILLFTGMMSWKFGITSPAIITIIIFVLVLFFDVGLNLIQTPVGAVEHFPTIIVGIVSAGFLVREFSR